MYDENGQYLLYDYEPGSELPALNTFAMPDFDYGGTKTPPFDHMGRLADKLFGAVELRIDNVLAADRIENVRNQRIYQQVAGQTSLLPPQASAFVTRNIGTITTFIVLFLVFFIGTRIAR